MKMKRLLAGLMSLAIPTHWPQQETGIEYSTNVLEYVRDQVTRDKLENLPVTGPGSAQFATVRITKWADSYDDDGTPKEEYKALGNAVFAIYLAHEDGTTAALLDTITTGLDNTNLEDEENLTAWASSYAFSYQGLLKTYGKLDRGDRTATKWDIFKEENGNASVRLILREISAPAGYSTPDHEFRMTLYFQKVEEGEGASETFNDLFYVKKKDSSEPQAGTIGSDWPCYAVDADGTLVMGEKQYRLVNLPIDNFAVTVNKYGYTVHDDNLNMTSAQLDAYYDEGTNGDDRAPLEVTMKLQHYNGTDKKWVDHVFIHADGSTSATFTTTDGWYTFPNGLPVGRYRLIETSGAAGYLRMYDGSALSGSDYYNAEAYYFTNATILDVFPFVGDRGLTGASRGSQWEMTFATDTYADKGNNTGVQLQRLDGTGNATILSTDQYEVFYYLNDITADNIDAVYDDVDQLHFGDTAPEGWTKTPTATATAIAVAVEKQDDSALPSHASYLAEYRLNVGNLSQEELTNRSWTNAVNNFIFAYDRYAGSQTADQATSAGKPIMSNSVSNTILPSLVQVGGHVWIDKNADGEWQADESVSQLTDNALVQSLLNHVEITLYTYEGRSDMVRQAESYATANDPDWKSEANFLFTDLEPASRMDNFTEDQLYSSGNNRDPLNPAILKGEAPKTYRVLATVPESAGILTQVTTLGGLSQKTQTGFSRHPDDLAAGGIHDDEASDNNFFAAGSTA